MSRVLVIAGQSFVGSHIVDALNTSRPINDVDPATQFEVYATTRRATSAASSESICDITDRAQVDRIINEIRPDCIVQCAGVITADQPENAQRVHIDGTQNVVHAILDHVPNCLLVALGSAAEYGPAPADALPLDETYTPHPASSYGETKLAQTRIIEQATKDGLAAYVLRPFNIIGPGLPATYFAAGLANRLRAIGNAAATEFDLFNPQATRDFVDVRDVARAVRRLLTPRSKPVDSIIYNVCTGLPTPLVDVAKFMGQLAGCHKPKAAGEAKSRGGISVSQGSYQKLHRACGWEPTIGWQTSIEDLWNTTK